VFAIGAYPEVSLADAREARDDARRLVRKGIHPAQERRRLRLHQVHEGASTFKAVAIEWIESNRKHWTPRTFRQRERLLERDMFPGIGALPMRDVTRAMGLSVIRQIEKRAPQMALIAKQILSSVSRLAVDTGRANMDLVYRHSIRTQPTRHKRPLASKEIPAFFEALHNYSGYFPTKIALRLLWLTLARPKEVLEAKWEEFDLEAAVWKIPSERMKMRQSHRVPLPQQAIEILNTLRPVTGHFDHLVPNRTNPKRHASHTILVKALHSMGYGGKLSPHGIRVTGRTLLGEQGYPREVLERQLAHRDSKHVRAYDQGDRLDARRIVMQQWADYIDGICFGGGVVPLFAQARR
jgi:integrase